MTRTSPSSRPLSSRNDSQVNSPYFLSKTRPASGVDAGRAGSARPAQKPDSILQQQIARLHEQCAILGKSTRCQLYRQDRYTIVWPWQHSKLHDALQRKSRPRQRQQCRTRLSRIDSYGCLWSRRISNTSSSSCNEGMVAPWNLQLLRNRCRDGCCLFACTFVMAILRANHICGPCLQQQVWHVAFIITLTQAAKSTSTLEKRVHDLRRHYDKLMQVRSKLD